MMVMQRPIIVLLAALLLLGLFTTAQHTPNVILNADDHLKVIREVRNGRLLLVDTVEPVSGHSVKLPVLHLWGRNAYEQGYAHGQIVADDIEHFLFRMLPLFYELGKVHLKFVNEYLPQHIQDLLRSAQSGNIATAVVHSMWWLYQHQYPWTSQEKLIDLEAEMDGIADGYCSVQKDPRSCINSDVRKFVKSQNMLPEFIRMSCSLVASWDEANEPLTQGERILQQGCTRDPKSGEYAVDMEAILKGVNSILPTREHREAFTSKDYASNSSQHKGTTTNEHDVPPGKDLIQLRALDFGGGPFANNQMLIVRHFSEFPLADLFVDFASLSFPGAVFVISAMSKYISQSQKVFMSPHDEATVQFDTRHPHHVQDSHIHLWQNEKHQPSCVASMNTEGEMIFINNPTISDEVLTKHDIEMMTREALEGPTIIDKYHQWMQEIESADSLKNPRLAQLRKLIVGGKSTQRKGPQGLCGLKPGTYDGLSDVFAIRLTMQMSKTLTDVIAIGERVERTWPIFLAYGTSLRDPSRFAKYAGDEYETPVVVFDWDPKHLRSYHDRSLPQVTSNEQIKHVVYVDKHPQPTRKAVLQSALQEKWGHITGQWMASLLPKITKSGDVHLLVYDWNDKSVYIGIGQTNSSFNYDEDGYAWERPLVKFSIDQLLDEKP